MSIHQKISVTDNTVFLLGAGFSKDLDCNMPIVSEIPGLLQFEEGSEAEKLRDPSFENEFEAWFSSLHARCPWFSREELLRANTAFKEVQQAIQTGLIPPTKSVIDSFLHLSQNPEPSEWIFRLLKIWDKHQSAVITLNYDTIPETVAAFHLFKGNIPKTRPNDFYPILPNGTSSNLDSFKIYKLHGSLNIWSRDLPKNNNLCIVDLDHEPSMHAHIEKGFLPFIVPPLSAKDSYYSNPYLRGIWAHAREKLQTADQLVVLGYSFPMSDWLMRLFLRNLNSNATVMVVDIAEEAAARAGEIFHGGGERVQKHIDRPHPIESFVNSIPQ